jgi:YaiO family outer membrane protein
MVEDANKHKGAKDFAGAEDVYRKWLLENPDDDAIRFSLAQVISWQKRYAEASDLYRTLLDKDPNAKDAKDAKLGLARIDYWQGNYKESLDRLDALALVDPDDIEIKGAREDVLKAVAAAEEHNFIARLAGDFQTYNYYNTASFGLRASLGYLKQQQWGVRGGVYGLTRYGFGAFQGTAGASIWLFPSWNFEVDADASTRGDILPKWSVTAATNLSLAEAFTPSFSFKYASYDSANAYMLMPALSWYVFPPVEFYAKLFIVFNNLPNNKMVTTYSGLGKITVTPFDMLSLFAGFAAGQEAFDPGNPLIPFASYTTAHAFGGAKVTAWGQVGIEALLDGEWRSNGQSVFSGEFGLFYRW